MNYKNIALLALLLPFSGYAITKQERKEEILAEMKKLEDRMTHVVTTLENNLWFAAFFPEYFRDQVREIDKRAYVLEDELAIVEKQLEQENHVS